MFGLQATKGDVPSALSYGQLTPNTGRSPECERVVGCSHVAPSILFSWDMHGLREVGGEVGSQHHNSAHAIQHVITQTNTIYV
jgi:hypothetical protein